MATQFKITAILTFVVGVQLIDLTNTINFVVCRVLNNDRPYVVLTVALAADAQSITVNSRWNQPTFIPPSKGAPKSTQGSGTR